ncbi:MAG TPA: autotransporter-associated beta strand repeat-containing protein, partial [Tepidisphaeraceae bacterium]|nr:autotransporter-associated beta strand repeat-containing protein [Tepidisphaeraceae bacterium]
MSRIVSSLKFPGNRHRKHAATLALACALSLAALPSARAVDITWDGGGASPLWTDLGNWSGGPPAPFNDAFIGSGFASGTDLVLNGPSTIKSLTINTATAFSIGRTVINQNIYLALDTGNLTRQNVSGAEAEQFLDIDVILGANGVWNIAGSNSLTVRGYINEFINTTPSLTKTGTGTLVLRATSQFALSGHYDGTTSLNQGRIRLVNNGGIGEGTVTVADGATLEMQSHPNGPDSPLRLTGFGVDLLFPVGSHDGALKNISGDSAWDGPITLLSDSSINVEADSLTLNGGIGDGAGTFELIKFGGGDLILPVASTHGGGTTVNGGRLIISNGGALGSAGTTSVGINGILGLKGDISVPRPISLSGANLGGTASLQNLEGNNTITGSITLVGNSAISTAATTTLTLTGLISDNGNARTLTKLGGGTLILNHTNSFTGGMIVSEGTLQLALLTAIASGTTTTVESGASVELPGGLTVTRLVQLNGGGFSSKGALSSVGNNTWNGGIVLQSNSSVGAEADGTFTISGAVSGAFTLSKVGPGTLVLNNAANSFGNLNINAGILAVSTPNGIPPASTVAVTATGAAIELSGNATINRPLSLKGDGISDGGALHNVAGSNTWSGNLALPSAASVRVDTATALVLSGAISGSGALTKSGAGMLTLTGANTYTGVTTLEEGVLRLQNSSALGSTPNLHVLAGAAVEIQNDIDVPRPLIVSGSSIQSTGALRSLAGANTFSGPLTLENHLTIGVDTGSTLTLGGALSDGAGVFTLTKVGAGTLVLGNAANTYDGGTFVNGGTLS